ncbi:EpsI family protein [Acidobacteria bacterium AB60]|nr:EpsI family protein [Acidobacteria bacterium AB60]
MNAIRFWTVTGLLVAALLVLAGRSRSEKIPERRPLSEIASKIGGWAAATDEVIPSDTLQTLGAGEFLSRVYLRSSHIPPVALFIGYFPTQRSGVTIHSPKHCLPGAGWFFEAAQSVQLVDTAGANHRLREYIIRNGDRRSVVIYWYQAHGRSVGNEYAAMAYLIADAVRLNRSDGALVRIMTPIGSNENTMAAKMRAESFVAQLVPLLPKVIPN